LSRSREPLYEFDSDEAGGVQEGKPLLQSEHGSFSWIWESEADNHRQQRVRAALDVGRACDRGGYTFRGKEVPFSFIRSMENSMCFVNIPQLDPRQSTVASRCRARWHECHRESLIKVVFNCVDRGVEVVIVSASSPSKPGGTLEEGGKHGPEEALCMQSTLLRSLKKAAHLHDGAPKVALVNGVSSYMPQGALLSPDVEFFRGAMESGYPLRSSLARVAAVISVAPPNCNRRITDIPLRPASDSEYMHLLEEKFKAVLLAVAKVQIRTLVIPPVGCDVYNNKPKIVGEAFGKVLRNFFPEALDDIYLIGCEVL